MRKGGEPLGVHVPICLLSAGVRQACLPAPEPVVALPEGHLDPGAQPWFTPGWWQAGAWITAARALPRSLSGLLLNVLAWLQEQGPDMLRLHVAVWHEGLLHASNMQWPEVAVQRASLHRGTRVIRAFGARHSTSWCAHGVRNAGDCSSSSRGTSAGRSLCRCSLSPPIFAFFHCSSTSSFLLVYWCIMQCSHQQCLRSETGQGWHTHPPSGPGVHPPSLHRRRKWHAAKAPVSDTRCLWLTRARIRDRDADADTHTAGQPIPARPLVSGRRGFVLNSSLAVLLLVGTDDPTTILNAVLSGYGEALPDE